MDPGRDLLLEAEGTVGDAYADLQWWNYHIHHVPYELEQFLQWLCRMLELCKILTVADRAWLPPRLAMQRAENIGIVHFSGDVKLWHM